MAKNYRPQPANPLAGIPLEDIVRNITATDAASHAKEEEVVEEVADTEDEEITIEVEGKKTKTRRGNMKVFEKNLAAYKGLNEQGFAIWLPRDVKKKLELIRLNASRTIPLRALASAIIMTYIQENEEKLNNL